MSNRNHACRVHAHILKARKGKALTNVCFQIHLIATDNVVIEKKNEKSQIGNN